MDQSVIDRAVNIETKCAMNGKPVRRILYEEPRTVSELEGSFTIIECESLTAADNSPWDK